MTNYGERAGNDMDFASDGTEYSSGGEDIDVIVHLLNDKLMIVFKEINVI